MISVILFKIGKQSDFHVNYMYFHIVGAWRNFTVVEKTDK